jgi:hypothetical protein
MPAMRPVPDPNERPRALHEPPPLDRGFTREDPLDPPGTAPAGGPSASAGPSLAQLIKDLRDETLELFRKEVSLAKSEMTEKGRRFARNAVYIAAGAAIGYLAAAMLVVTSMIVLIIIMRAMGAEPGLYSWLAPLLVAIVVGLVAYALIRKGINTLRRESLVPTRTVASLQENKEWIGNKIK